MPFSRKRREQILRLLEENQTVQVADLAKRFNVSEVTIRRDLNQLRQHRGIERVYGGAILTQREREQPPLSNREVIHPDAKRWIGRAAAELVEPGDTIIIGGGTTTVELARNLVHAEDLVVITPALNIAATLAESPGVTLLVTGGILVGPELTLAGHFGEQMLASLNADKLFIGSCAFDPETGVTSAHVSEIGINQAMFRSGTQRILLVDHSKFNQIAPYTFGDTEQLDCVVTDSQAPAESLDALEKLGVQVIQAGPP
jgi:DeoR/GlpR family transcriptional regulator of sugar metabolism